MDGTSPNGLRAILWNASTGLSDNITDTIGPSGNSGTSNVYMIDCESLATPCMVGDLLSIKILEGANGTKALNSVNVTVTGAGFDVAGNITLNSRPNVTLNYPTNNSYVTTNLFNLTCTAGDLDSNLQNLSLFGNWSGGWHLNQTVSALGGEQTNNFTKSLVDGNYLWNCLAFDNVSSSNFAPHNFTFILDSTAPIINGTGGNLTGPICGVNEMIRLTCDTYDNFTGIDTVLFKIQNPQWTLNKTGQLLLGYTYYADILLNETGIWDFTCIVNDSAGNRVNTTMQSIEIKNGTVPELLVQSEDINLSNENPMEKVPVSITAIIHNNGCINAENVIVQFFDGEPILNNQIESNRTINVTAFSNATTNVTWISDIGPNNFFVLVDPGNFISEANESNNQANKSIEVTAWQDIYGKISVDELLGNGNLINLSFWFNGTSLAGNIFVSDTESSINWDLLLAIGKNTTGQNTSNDFQEIDSYLNMTAYNDSVSSIFTTDGNTPISTKNFSISQGQMVVLPIINSTNNSNFVTGILWDSSDDTDGEFGGVEKEDLVFVTEINKEKQGAYGIYDYEIKIPVRLRSYDTTDEAGVYLYFNLN